jgi:hypothetical protein
MSASDHPSWVYREARIGRILVAVLVGAAMTSCAGIEQTRRPTLQPSTPTPTPTASLAVVIDAPRDGISTHERTALVRGHLTGVPAGGATLVTMRVNRRRFLIDPRGGRFRVRVVLEVGRNRIGADAEFFGLDEIDQPPLAKATASPVDVTRNPGRGTVRLDRATALWVAEGHRDVYWVCGESDDCLAEPLCVQVSTSRVDCPVKTRFEPDDATVCGVVIGVRLQGRRLYSFSYACSGRWRANPRIFVHPDVQLAGRRYRVDEKNAPWLEDEVNQRNRYGIPRIDAFRDVFIP